MWRVPRSAGDTGRLGGMVDALDSKSSSRKECGFESHSRYAERRNKGGSGNAAALVASLIWGETWVTC